MKKTPENLVKQEIKDYLDATGWSHFPILQGLGAHKGICDRIAIQDGIVLFIEIKAPGRSLSENQKKFMEMVKANRGHYLIVTGYKDIERYIHWLKHWLKQMKVQ